MTTFSLRRSGRWILPALAAGGLAVGTGLALTSQPAAASTSQPAGTFTLHGTALRLPNDGFVDIGNNGPSVGDVELIADTLKDASHHQVGIDRGTCTIIHYTGPVDDPTSGETSCVATVALTDGTLTFQGIEYVTKNTVDGAITGGTGRYVDASGWVRIVLSGGGDSSTWTFHLHA